MMLDAAVAQSEDGLIQDIIKNSSLESLSTDQLWELYELVAAQLGCKIAAKRDILELRLRKLGVAHSERRRERRPYPKVFPKYRNPKDHGETWAGRGKQPRWLTKELRFGKDLTDFLIR
ncbi:H-NS family nucleoid-associated regulatory protein [Bradyrhizobium canariense]|nr:H-NS histone family protein [Bradyrhizobium canariense]